VGGHCSREGVTPGMAEEIEKLCGKISLTGGENKGLIICEGELAGGRERADRCLVGKVGSDRRVNKEAFQTVLSQLWRTVGSVMFKEVQDNIWLFEFTDKDDKERVLEGRPWSFDRHILVLNDFDGSIPPSQMEFTHSPFWVQVHDMPLLCMNKAVGMRIGESMGEVEDVDVSGDGSGWGRCLRIRVRVNLLQPLERGRALQVGGKSNWVNFKYEKLPRLCFTCGRILHGLKGCPVKGVQRRSADDSLKEWGVWLRADDPRRRAGGEKGGGFTYTEGAHGGRSTFRGWDTSANSSKSGTRSRENSVAVEVGSKGVESSRGGDVEPSRGGIVRGDVRTEGELTIAAKPTGSAAGLTGDVGSAAGFSGVVGMKTRQNGGMGDVEGMQVTGEAAFAWSVATLKDPGATHSGDVGNTPGHVAVVEQLVSVVPHSDDVGHLQGTWASVGSKNVEALHVVHLPSLRENVCSHATLSEVGTMFHGDEAGGMKGRTWRCTMVWEGVFSGEGATCTWRLPKIWWRKCWLRKRWLLKAASGRNVQELV
jgi:hypothetical protein